LNNAYDSCMVLPLGEKLMVYILLQPVVISLIKYCGDAMAVLQTPSNVLLCFRRLIS